jgi:hypothetical protein
MIWTWDRPMRSRDAIIAKSLSRDSQNAATGMPAMPGKGNLQAVLRDRS